MNNLLFSLAMAALGQFTGLGAGGTGGGFAGPGIGFGDGPGGPRYGGTQPGQRGSGYSSPGYGGPGYGGSGGITVAPWSYGARPVKPGVSPGTAALQLASLTAARCLEQSGQLAPGEKDALLQSQGRVRGWANGWQHGISSNQSERLLSRYGSCDALLAALRQGSLGRDRLGADPIGRAPHGDGLISQQPHGLDPSRSTPQPHSEAEAFGLAPYR